MQRIAIRASRPRIHFVSAEVICRSEVFESDDGFVRIALTLVIGEVSQVHPVMFPRGRGDPKQHQNNRQNNKHCEAEHAAVRFPNARIPPPDRKGATGDANRGDGVSSCTANHLDSGRHVLLFFQRPRTSTTDSRESAVIDRDGHAKANQVPEKSPSIQYRLHRTENRFAARVALSWPAAKSRGQRLSSWRTAQNLCNSVRGTAKKSHGRPACVSKRRPSTGASRAIS